MPTTAMSVQFVQSSLAECGVSLPPTAQRASDTLTALQAEASRDVVAEALAAASSSPLTPKNAGKRVQELAGALTARDRAGEAAQHYERVVLDQFRDAIVASSDDLIIAMRPYFDEAAAILHTAGTLIDPDVPPTVNDGLDVLEVAQSLDEASRRLSAVQTARVRVAEMRGYAVADASWFIESAADDEALRLARLWKKRSWHRLTRAGFKLRLNTPAEAEAVVLNAARSAAEVHEAEQRARREASRDPLRDAYFAQVLGDA